jgi:acetyl-CoA carboxylase biotin carboxyl carrier protein
MTFREIQELIRLLSKTNVTEFKLKQGDFEVTIRTEEYVKAKAQPAPIVTSVSPMVSVPAPIQPVAQPSAPAQSAPSTEVAPAPVAEKAPTPTPAGLVEVKSPIVGTFYRSPSPEKPPYIQVGEKVTKGQVVCIIEAMKLFNEIESDATGKVVKVLVDDAQPVEYDQPLFLVDPNG